MHAVDIPPHESRGRSRVHTPEILELWKTSLGSQIVNSPMTYEVDGTQYVAIISGHSLSTFALRD